MSYIGAYTQMLFGSDGTLAARASGGANHQNVPESVVLTTSRTFKGAQAGGRYSLHVKNFAGAAPVGTLTVWYSNLPNPDPDVDADWVQIAIAGTPLDLSVVANTWFSVADVVPEHIRLKVTRTSGTISLVVWVRSERTS